MEIKERWGEKFVDNRDWEKYNEELVVRGEFLISMEFVESWQEELDKMNEGKRGAPFQFPESLIRLQAIWHQWIDYRGLEGITRKLADYHLVPKFNDFSTINRRVNKLEIEFELPKSGNICASTDGSGMKITNGGSYKERKYGKKRKKYIKVTITADPKRRKLLGCDVSIEGEGDSEPETALKHLKDLEEKGKKVEKFWGDGSYDTLALFNYLDSIGAKTAIKPRITDTSDDPNSVVRKEFVEDFNKKGYEKWAKDKNYGLRWVGTEGIFSAVKRKFGEDVRAKKIENMLKEVKRKFWAYDLMKEHAILSIIWKFMFFEVNFE